MEFGSPTLWDAKSGIDVVIHNSVRDRWSINKSIKEYVHVGSTYTKERREHT